MQVADDGHAALRMGAMRLRDTAWGCGHVGHDAGGASVGCWLAAGRAGDVGGGRGGRAGGAEAWGRKARRVREDRAAGQRGGGRRGHDGVCGCERDRCCGCGERRGSAATGSAVVT